MQLKKGGIIEPEMIVLIISALICVNGIFLFRFLILERENAAAAWLSISIWLMITSALPLTSITPHKSAAWSSCVYFKRLHGLQGIFYTIKQFTSKLRNI